MDFKTQIEFLHKDFPLRDLTALAAEAVRCVREYDKNKRMRSLMFSGQDRWDSSSSPREIWETYAAAAGADMEKWRACINSRTYQNAVESDRKLGMRMGVNATPTIFIGDRKIVGAVPFRELAAAVQTQIKR